MRILVRTNSADAWTVVESASYSAEAHLQQILSDTPSIVPLRDIREGTGQLLVAIRELGLPGSGNTDLICFSELGDIAVIECKLASNAEIKRKVIGQVFEYAAYLWGMSYEALDERIRVKRGASLVELVGQQIPDPAWDSESFRQRVADSLQRGEFSLVVAVDSMNEELSRTVAYLNNSGLSTFTLAALEMRRFESGTIEVLVPHLHGPVLEGPSLTRKGRRQWTEEQFLAAVEQLSAAESTTIRGLYEWTKKNADKAYFGTGAETGSFTAHYLNPSGQIVSIFTVYTDGRLMLNYGWMTEDRVPRSTLEEFHEKITALSAFQNIAPDFTKWPSVRLGDRLADDKSELESFKLAVQELGQKAKAGF